jgi:hypothetical protein
MTSTSAPADGRLGAGRFLTPARLPDRTQVGVHQLTTADGASVSGVLRTVPGARTVVCFMHPRMDLTHHALVPELLTRGFAVWTQGTRSVNNDVALIHEQALLDVAAGQVFLREQPFDAVVTLGASGGATLFAYYLEQADLPAAARLRTDPGGRPTRLGDALMPLPDAAVFMAPHPGPGELLRRLIDPSVTDEADPLSIDPSLDMYDPDNGFRPAPEPSTYHPDFLARYRQAQHDRVARLDALAHERVAETKAARKAHELSQDPADRRASLARRVMTVYRTDADPHGVDLSLDPNKRPYGSLFGRRPDLTNYGMTGFARLLTPEAWLSTWSALSSHANFLRCAPSVTVPALFIELTGDQACFPDDANAMCAALGPDDLTRVAVDGTHFGAALTEGAPTGNTLASAEIADWFDPRAPGGGTSG